MNNLEVIKSKINSIGGVQKNPSCNQNIINEINGSLFFEFEKKIGARLPDLYKGMYEVYGPFSFKKSIRVKCKDSNPVADEYNTVSVDYFYSIENATGCSIIDLLKKYSLQLPEFLIPICDGESGDLICVDVRKGNSAKIYYWSHEESSDRNLFLIEENFFDFILKLEVKEDTDEEKISLNKITVNPSKELLEMLRKSGFGPK